MALARASKILKHFQSLERQSFDKLLLDNTTLHSADSTETQLELVFSITAIQDFSNAFGPVHGGAYATMVDLYTTLAILAADKNSRATVSVDLSLSYLSAVNPGEEMTISAVCNKVGRSMAFSTAEIRVGDRLVVTAKHTKYVLDRVIEISD